jgi:hypothetical protein
MNAAKRNYARRGWPRDKAPAISENSEARQVLETLSGPLTNQQSRCIMARTDLTAARLRELLSYDRDTGVFTRAIATGRNGSHKAGVRSGYTTPLGYVEISVDNKSFKAHRLAWLYVYGVWPNGHIDHIDGQPGNNAIANLREADDVLNGQNIKRAKKSNKSSGLLGVSRNGPGWSAHIQTRGVVRYLGQFRTPEDAHQAYLTAKRELHEFCTI